MINIDIRRTVFPLRLIFWGAIICIIDITFSSTTNGEGFKFDLLDDAVGAAMIAWGVSRLAGIYVQDRYRRVMRFVKIVAFLNIIDAIRDHFIMKLPDAVSFGLLLFSLLCLIAIVSFCVAMRWLCEEAALSIAVRSWRVTTVLFIVIYLVPLGLSYCASMIALVSGSSFNIDLGPLGILLLLVFLVPVVHLFISTSRMIRSARDFLPPNQPFQE
jgi:hypothetical protein